MFTEMMMSAGGGGIDNISFDLHTSLPFTVNFDPTKNYIICCSSNYGDTYEATYIDGVYTEVVKITVYFSYSYSDNTLTVSGNSGYYPRFFVITLD